MDAPVPTSELSGSSPPVPALPSLREILHWPVIQQPSADTWLLRGLSVLARRQIRVVHGLRHVLPDRDPFILALNHSTRREAILIPALLILMRSGRCIHFMADWNFCLIPGMSIVYRRAQVITVGRKPARPRLLNIFKPLFVERRPALERAREHLENGRSIGVFPEGTVNRNGCRLLRGRNGAARLSVECSVPIVPVGVRFPQVEAGRPVPEGAAMDLHVGPPMRPPAAAGAGTSMSAINNWHATVMEEIGRLSGKAWRPR